MNNCTYLLSNQPENQFIQNSDQKNRKKFAQFFTPFDIASFMASWVIANRKNLTILDPSIGLGILARAAYKLEKNLKFIGYDIDSTIITQAKKLFNQSSIKTDITFFCEDYLLSDWSKQYDGIICNPPYLKFHDFPNKEYTLKNFYDATKIKLSGFSNIYTLFLIKSILQLKKGGRLACIIPSEFLNSDYGVEVKNFLKQNQTLRYTIIFDFKQNLFNNALTTSSILLFANDNLKQDTVFINIYSKKELTKIQQNILNYPQEKPTGNIINFSILEPQLKWRVYYNKNALEKYRNLVPFSQYAKVVRGIATGANDYFTFNKGKKKQFQIPDEYLLPCICKSNQVKKSIFTDKDFDDLYENNSQVLLLNAENYNHKKVKEYINLGLELKINKKYLTSHRNPWYGIEKRLPSPIWVGVFNRKGIKFIRNEANIRNLTTFHCIYIHSLFLDKVDILFAYFLTKTAQEIFNDNRREYGGGLRKFEPNDLNQSKVINLDIIDNKTTDEIRHLYKIYRKTIFTEKETNHITNKINEIFLSLLTLY